ncbi:MAG: HIT family protein [Idiomarina sp.]|uniref:HIT family protein n=1 Tax=Idiomarina sp. TaxID=1874361 RepID=UPI000C5914E0|nr:HIT family protein [Idiomarina sp.]MBT42352.1 HIT family protein [Idiomarina sp.]
MAEFELHPQLAKDSLHLADWPLSQVRVINDASFPWFLLVPRIPNIIEVIDLSENDQQQLWRESAFLSHWLKAEYRPDKLNLAAIGNKVPQLHLHHIARYTDDPAWPDPVWGRLPPQPLAEQEVVRLQQVFRELTL